MSETVKRIMVMGNAGSGKSTLAKQLSTMFGLPAVHLDRHYWLPGWVEDDKKVWIARAKKLADKDEWVIDGNYGDTIEYRVRRADLVILLEFPIWLSLYRVIRRYFKYRGQNRPDMAPGCQEKIDWEFIHFVLTYKIVRKQRNRDRIKNAWDRNAVRVIKSPRALRKLLEELPKEYALNRLNTGSPI